VVDSEPTTLLTANPDAFAHRLLAGLGLPFHPLVPVASWSNRVWLAPAHVLRLSSGRFRGAFAHEKAVISLLPLKVPHAPVRSYGQISGREWLVQDRVAGRPLLDVWPHLSAAQRQSAAYQLGIALKAFHEIPVPPGFSNPLLDDALALLGKARDAYHAPPSQYHHLTAAASSIPGVDSGFLEEVEAFIDSRLDAFDDDRAVLVHADAHFSNVLWDGDRLTAILDYEGTRLAPPDQELDTILRQTREPALYCAPGTSAVHEAHDFSGFVETLAKAYPSLFEHPRLSERLEAYEAMWHLVQLLHFPPGTGHPDPYGHLQSLLDSKAGWTAW
jgi:hygromycin-B 7''-O-kinase